jgi:hypothetical protein
LGLLGGSTQPDATDVAAVLDVNGGGTNGLFRGNTNGSTADVAAAIDVNLGGTDGVQGNTDSGLGATVDLGLGLDTSGLLDETTVDVGGSVIIGGSTDSAENPGTTDPGTGTAGPGTGTTGDTDTPGPGTETPAAGTDSTDAGTGTTDTAGSGAGGFTVVPAGLITGAVTTGAGGPAADAPAQGGSQTLAKTGLDASLIPLALTLMVAGVLLLRRRRAS